MLMHSGLICVTFCLPRCLSVSGSKFRLDKSQQTEIHISGTVKVKGHKRSRTKVRVKVQVHYKCKRKGRWAHANVKLLYFNFSGLGVGYYLFGAIRAIIDFRAAEEIFSINGDGDPATTDSSLPDLQEPILS